jgi:hypothetical protein
MTSTPGRLPDFLVIGAMRSGTSSLARYLRAHPSICLATQKEVHFFDRNFDQGIEWYRRHFPCSHAGHLTGEATQTYLFDKEALDQMASVVPDARIIVILRHPIDRAYSHYWLNRSRGREPLEFAAAIEAEPHRVENGGLNERFWYSYLGRGRYTRQLVAVAERYPRDRVSVHLFDELRDSPEATYGSICDFLGVDNGFHPPNLGTVVNPYVTFRSLRVRALSRRLPAQLRKAVARVNTRVGMYPAMDVELRRDLIARFEEEIVSLESWLGKDLSLWRK